MEGTWGKRVYAKVEPFSEDETRFTLWLTVASDMNFEFSMIAFNADLEEDPKMFGVIMDILVEEMDRRIRNHMAAWFA